MKIFVYAFSGLCAALVGLVSFPSFHTAAATLLAIAAWPDRRLRAVILPMDAAMLLSIPVEGTHYLIDMIGGAGVALIATLLVVLFERRGDMGVAWRTIPQARRRPARLRV